MKILPLITSLLALAVSASADVVIYKGTAKVIFSNPSFDGVDVPAGTYSATAKITIVTDPATLQTRVVGAIKVPFKIGPFTRNYKFVDVTNVAQIGKLVVKKGKANIVSLYSGSFQYLGSTTFNGNSVLLKGTEATLRLDAQEEPATTLLPKVISGTATFFGSNNGDGGSVSNAISARYNQAATLLANEEGQTLQEAADAAAEAYREAGYDDDVQAE